MITKGHHYPRITLVGVVDADLGLRWPDFRAAERTYQQILQAAGRAGRGEQRGRVIVQTMSPEHHAIRAASAYDEERFYAQELRFRRQFGYPPFARLALVRIQAPDEARGSEAALETARRAGNLARRHGVEVLGPAPAPLYRLRRFYRWHLLLKASGSKNLHALLEELLDARGPRRPGFEVRLDLDPVNML
jgi:primosomal protein N' (replication factor Y)